MAARRAFLSVLLVSCAFIGTAQAEDLRTQSKVTAATIYADRATVTRSAKVQIPSGAHNVVFTDIPLGLMPDSLRVSGSAVAKVTFGAISHKVENHLDFIQPRERELNTQLEKLTDQRRLHEIELEALAVGKGFIENLGKQAALRSDEAIAELDLKPESWSAVADTLALKISENRKAAFTQDVAIRAIDEEIRKIRDELAQLRTGSKQTYSITIPLESAAATTLSVDLSYQVHGASWQPVYDARLETSDAKMQLVQYGSVWQQTGEDWSGVDLTLSTAQPSRGAGLPDLHTTWIWLEQAQKELARGRANYDYAAGADAVATMEMLAAPTAARMMKSEIASPAPVEAAFAPAYIDTQGFVGEYKIVGKSDVKSDGTQSKLMIGGFETDSVMQVQVKPQISHEAFLVVKSKLKGDAPILPGQVNLFRDGAFIGQSYLPMMRGGDESELGFGIDDNVTVRRNTLKDERSEAGLITKDSVLERHFRTEVQNLHKTPVEVVVLETIPVAQNDKIRVEILKDKTTAGYEQDIKNVKGVTRWTLKLEPAAKSAVDLGWRVSWPKAEQIGGI